MTIYRVEHGITGMGPHSLDSPVSHYSSWNRPIPPEWLKHWPEQFMFAFRSLRKAARWFSKRDRKCLRQCGYVLVKLEVPDSSVIYKDHAQVAFKTSQVKFIKCLAKPLRRGA